MSFFAYQNEKAPGESDCPRCNICQREMEKGDMVIERMTSVPFAVCPHCRFEMDCAVLDRDVKDNPDMKVYA